jgi:NTP pyrophosphatase (non-canonical NTP hydrolase)
MTRSIEIMDQIADRLKMLPEEKERFLWLALAGEVGEACNIVKKQWRDGFTIERVEKLKTELADVYIYLRVLESFYGLDVHARAQEKMKEVETRPFARTEHSREAIAAMVDREAD